MFEQVKQGKYVRGQLDNNTAAKSVARVTHGETSNGIKLVDVPIVTPTSDVLVEKLSFELPNGEHLLVTVCVMAYMMEPFPV